MTVVSSEVFRPGVVGSLECSGKRNPPVARNQAQPLPFRSAWDPARPQRLDITTGTTARYKVQEQLAGVNFPSQAVGTTQAVTGTIVVNPDGSLAPESKISVDLTKIESDQSMRDGYVRGRVLETDKFPTLQFVPSALSG